MTDAFSRLEFSSPVIPVVSLTHIDQALPLAQSLIDNGIDVIEITLRHPSALPAIAQITAARLPIKVLAGTVLTAEQLRAVHQAGAIGALSPCLDLAVLIEADALNLPFIPGVMTPSEVNHARQHGYHALKFFPAAQAGGVGALAALAAVFPDVRFCPTGGLNLANAADYLRLPNVVTIGGSWLTPKALLEAGQWQEIGALGKAASQLRG